MDKYKAMEIITAMAEKGIVEIKVENNKSGKKEEYLYLEPLNNKMLNLLIDLQLGTNKTVDTNIFAAFETELGRTLSAMEIEIIKEWIHSGVSEELIKEALKEAILNNVRNLKYIDRILYNWKNLGIKTKKDIIKEKKNFRKKQATKEPIYDYNWLEEE